MSAFSTAQTVLNLAAVVEAVSPSLLPPVSNRMVFDDALKAMLVGGPNQRRDFHIEQGAEVFLQLRGPMDVLVVHPSTQREQRVRIEEGEMFYLPPGVPHSPQRYADTVGLVLERVRDAREWDALRWYTPRTETAEAHTDTDTEAKAEVQYEEFFYCAELGSQIKSAILRYHAFCAAPHALPPVPAEAQPLLDCMARASERELPRPFSLRERLAAMRERGEKTLSLLDNRPIDNNNSSSSQGEEEFSLVAYRGQQRALVAFPSFVQELFLWQFSGAARVTFGETTLSLGEGEILLLSKERCGGAESVCVETTSDEDVLIVSRNVVRF